METPGNGENEAEVVHHTQSRRTTSTRRTVKVAKQEQVRGDWDADSGRVDHTSRSATGGILRGLISQARDQIKLLENQIGLWESQLDSLEALDNSDSSEDDSSEDE